MPVESVESQPQDSPYFHEPLGNPYRGFPIPTAPTTNSFHILLSVDGCRSLRRNIIAPASLLSDVIGLTSDSLIDFAGIPKALNRRGAALARPLLLVQFLLLTCVLIVSVAFHSTAHPNGLTPSIAGMIAVSAMACQFSLLRLAVPGAPSTAVMTGNLTKTVLSLLDTLSLRPVVEDAREQLKKTLQLIVPFFIGCLAGAAALSWLGDWAWSLPVVLAGMALILVPVGQND